MAETINILIVDDEPKNLTVLETVLDEPGYRLVRTQSAEQALLALVDEEFALLILDIRMPGMTGFELAQMIRNRKRTAGVPIIFLTAYYNEDQHVLDGYGAGAVDYLHKPVNATILRSKVAVFADLHRKSRECVTANRALFAEVTERRRADEQLRELNASLEQRVTERTAAVRDSEMRYRRLFEAARDGILILDLDCGAVIDANPFMTDLLGYSRAEFLGLELWQLGIFIDKSANEAAVRELQEKGYLRYEHLRLESKVGRRVEVEVVANSYQENGKSVIQCNIRDTTERSRLETQLQEQAGDLSELHRRKDEFLAMLSHELRSPLAPIANAVQLLGLQQASENRIQQEARGIIERQVRQLQHLVDDLLEVTRITTGRVHLRRERVDTSAIVRAAEETVRPLIEQRRQELTVSLPPKPLWLDADGARLEQVLVNLLGNATKYTQEGGHVWLTVEVDPGEETGPEDSPTPSVPASLPGSHILFRVRDNGVGIDPGLLPRIFDLFTQAERSLDRSQGGLGIGLALVQRLTELHGGTVTVHSTLGSGSEFLVRLPLLHDERQEAHCEGGRAPSPITAQSPFAKRLRVLVVDDNVDTVLSYRLLLEAHGHEVWTAHDGLDAVQKAIACRPDIVVLDIGLPGLNGYQAAQRMRLEPALKNTVLVASTGYGQDSDRQLALQAGFDHHLVKPAVVEQLLQIMAPSPTDGGRQPSILAEASAHPASIARPG